MQIDAATMAKADHRLRDALVAAVGPEELRVILTLRAGDEVFDKTPVPGEFGTREEYRRAMIERRERHMKQSVGEAVLALRSLGLQLLGENLMRTVVADGTAEQIANAMRVQGVERATLDRPLELIRTVAKATEGQRG